MPQMAPYNWLNLFILFNLTLYFMITYIFFIYKLSPPKMKFFKKKMIIWKW